MRAGQIIDAKTIDANTQGLYKSDVTRSRKRCYMLKVETYIGDLRLEGNMFVLCPNVKQRTMNLSLAISGNAD